MTQRLEVGVWPRHRHRSAYAAVVLSGGYLEAGGAGRWQVGAGDVLAHPAFDAHQNVLARKTVVLNIPLPWISNLPPVFRVRDPDLLAKMWRQDPRQAADLLTPVEARAPIQEDWPDLLAADLERDPGLSIGAWARAHNLAPATVSRGFAAAFGAPPAVARAEQRARRAWRDLVAGTAPLAAVAHDHGFADQAHLSRAIRALTGLPPRDWRRVKSVQDAAVLPP